MYNYVAKDGVQEIDFLPRSEVPTYTIIKDNGQIGIDLPEMIFESGTGKRIPVKYATTKGGQIFTWPPFDYEEKFYITDTDTVGDKLQTQITVGDEKFEIKLDEDGGLLDLPENWFEDDDYGTPDEPVEHVHDFSSKTPTSTYLHTEATCTESPVYYYKCTGCTEKGTETYSDGSPLGHSFNEYTIIKTPNCTETGISQGTCIRCNQFSNADVPIDPNNHHGTETPVITKEPTCKELGVKTYKCSSCNAELRTESIDLVAHSFGPFVTTKEATCKEKGEQTKYCSGCGKSEKEELPIDTTRHYGVEKMEETKKASCSEKGLVTYRCSLCAEVIRTEETEKNMNNHANAETEKETEDATCTETGEIIEKCSLCKTQLSSILIPALGHSWSALQPPRKCNRCGLEEKLTAQVLYTSGDNTLTFVNEFYIYKVGDTFNGKQIVNTYVGIEEENYSRGWDSISGDVKNVVVRDEIKPISVARWFAGFSNCETIDIANLNTTNVTNMEGTFENCTNLIALDVSNFSTTNVTQMASMFSGCEKIENLELGRFNTSKVTSLAEVFKNCKSLQKLVLNSFNTENVTDMNNIFAGCTNLTEVNVSTFKTNNVTQMDYMFADCSALQTIDLSNFNTDNVEGMEGMFSNCSSLIELNISNFTTPNVKDMSYMFNSCNNLEIIEVSKFDTENVENMQSMFYDCLSVRRLDVSGWQTDKVTNMNRLFGNCQELLELDVSQFNTEHVTDIAEMFSYCSNLETLDVSNFKTSQVTDMSYVFNEMHNISELNVSNFDTTSMTAMDNIFKGCGTLEKITFGDNFTFSGENSYLPVPNEDMLPGATGVWYDLATGTSYLPENIPSEKAATYVAITPSYAYNVKYESTSGMDLGGTTVTKQLGTTNIISAESIIGYNLPEAQEIIWDSAIPKTITFIYTPTKYNITINCNGGSGENTRVYTIETETFTLNTPTKKGYTFAGWTDINGVTTETVIIEKGSVGARSYTANWSANSYTYNVVYESTSGINLGGTTVTKQLETVNIVTAEEIIGYNTPNSQEITWDSVEPKTITFIYSPTVYSITVNCNGGEGVSHTTYTIETETFTLGTPIREGYTFGGWIDIDGVTHETVTIEKGSYGVRNYTASWVGITYTYTLKYESTSGISLGETTITNAYGTINSVEVPDITGYDNPGPQEVIWDTVDSKTVIVIYTPTRYNVTIDCNGGDGVGDTSYTIERETFTLDTPEREGYTFKGWTGSNGTTPELTITIEKGSTGDKNYTANWIGKTYAYNVEYVSTSGIYLGGTTAEYELGTTNTVEALEIEGYDAPESQEIEWDTATPKLITFTYSPINYSITIDCNGGEGVETTTYNIETETFTLGTPTREGYTFIGWTDSEGVTQGTVIIEQGSIGARNYTAQWGGDIYVYNVVYESTSGKELYRGTVGGRLDTVNEVSGDEIEGYVRPEPQQVAWDTMEPKTITFIYELIDYNIEIDCAGGSGVESRTYNIETETFALGKPTREGYTFVGWTGSNVTTAQTSVSIEQGSIGDKEYSANWTVNNYTITYNLDGGSVATANPTTYNIETNTFTLNNPTKSNYNFIGWTGSNGTTLQTTVSIAKGSVGDKSYTANWKWAAGLYDENDNLIASWDTLVNTYGMDIERDYSTTSTDANYYQTTASSAYYVLTNNTELANGTKIIVGENVINIGKYAFGYCSKLTDVTISDSVINIDEGAFFFCSKLKNVIFGKSVNSIGSNAFWTCPLESVNLPDGLISIGSSAIASCKATNINIPGSVSNIEENAFWYCRNVTAYTVDSSNNNYCAVDGVLYTKDMTTIIRYPVAKEITTFTIPNSVTRIAKGAFHAHPGITSVGSVGSGANVEISDSVTVIGDRAFCDCENLTNVTIPKNVTRIESYAFLRTKLTSATFMNTSGWKVSTSKTATTGTSVTVTNKSTAATYLKSTYYNYYWFR